MSDESVSTIKDISGLEKQSCETLREYLERVSREYNIDEELEKKVIDTLERQRFGRDSELSDTQSESVKNYIHEIKSRRKSSWKDSAASTEAQSPSESAQGPAEYSRTETPSQDKESTVYDTSSASANSSRRGVKKTILEFFNRRAIGVTVIIILIIALIAPFAGIGSNDINPSDKRVTSSGQTSGQVCDSPDAGTMRVVSEEGVPARHNVISFATDSITTYNDVQYVAFLNATGHVNIASRPSVESEWSVEGTGLRSDVDDPHDIISIGFDNRGYIHIAWGMHADPLRYARSQDPEDPSEFDRIGRFTGSREQSLTYPQFFRVNETLFFTARKGTHRSGYQTLAKYDSTNESWEYVYERWIDGTATSTGPYIDNIVVTNETIHAIFNFRYQIDPSIQHRHYAYTYSSDGGETWRRTNASRYKLPITEHGTLNTFTAGSNESLANQNSLTIDGNGNPHISYLKESTNGHLNYYHTWYNGREWKTNQITEFTNTPEQIITYFEKDIARPGIITNRISNRVYILTRRGKSGNVTVYTAIPPYDNYEQFQLAGDNWAWQEFGPIDRSRWHKTRRLTLITSEFSPNRNESAVHSLSSTLCGVSA